ncbi:hypothetical protein EST38_g3784 [Candolleomyces aberdarensis]|uniref:Uncharacterized protein n=1 Tax=Candolleomyces aberdarensis TaxID=2316362 RepID=A0A4Q2DPW5_9AGAR|nr:hypothetical protein EST38_g3784 [Candolleomyces aberdarensis]
MTLYGLHSVPVEEAQIMTRTWTTVPVAPSTTRTRVEVASSCVGVRCVYTTRTFRDPLPGSSSTVTSTFYATSGRTTVEAHPTATLYSPPAAGDSCTIAGASTTTHTSFASIPSASPTQTLVNDGPGGDGSGQRSINVGAIVGGLLGGFLAPILFVLLIRWLKRKGLLPTIRLPRPAGEMRSVHDRPLSPTIPRPTSPAIATSLHRKATVSDGGHSNITHTTVNSAAEQANLDRRASRASRLSRASYGSYDRRGAISPVGSFNDFAVIGGGSSAAAAAAGAATVGGSSNVARRGSIGQSHPPVSFVPHPEFYNTHPSGAAAAVPISPPPHAYYAGSSASGGGGYVMPFEHRRAVSPVRLSDHPYAHAQPVPTGNGNGYGAVNGNGYGTANGSGYGNGNGNGNGLEHRGGSVSPAISDYMTAQSNHGHGYLPSVEEQDQDFTPPAPRPLEIRREDATLSQSLERDNAAALNGQDLSQDDDRTIRSASDENSRTIRTLTAP